MELFAPNVDQHAHCFEISEKAFDGNLMGQ